MCLPSTGCVREAVSGNCKESSLAVAEFGRPSCMVVVSKHMDWRNGPARRQAHNGYDPIQSQSIAHIHHCPHSFHGSTQSDDAARTYCAVDGKSVAGGGSLAPGQACARFLFGHQREANTGTGDLLCCAAFGQSAAGRCQKRQYEHEVEGGGIQEGKYGHRQIGAKPVAVCQVAEHLDDARGRGKYAKHPEGAAEVFEKGNGNAQIAVSGGSRTRRLECRNHAGQAVHECHVHERQDGDERERGRVDMHPCSGADEDQQAGICRDDDEDWKNDALDHDDLHCRNVMGAGQHQPPSHAPCFYWLQCIF